MFCHIDIYSGEFNELLLSDGYGSKGNISHRLMCLLDFGPLVGWAVVEPLGIEALWIDRPLRGGSWELQFAAQALC